MGGVPGWVIPVHPARCSGRVHVPAKRARKPCRGWSGGNMEPGALCQDHPAGPVGYPGTLPVLAPLYRVPTHGRLNLQNLRITSYFSKVSQNGRVSPEYVEKACHSPYFQNGLRNSPLDFLGFLISPAFSPKELMGLI